MKVSPARRARRPPDHVVDRSTSSTSYARCAARTRSSSPATRPASPTPGQSPNAGATSSTTATSPSAGASSTTSRLSTTQSPRRLPAATSRDDPGPPPATGARALPCRRAAGALGSPPQAQPPRLRGHAPGLPPGNEGARLRSLTTLRRRSPGLRVSACAGPTAAAPSGYLRWITMGRSCGGWRGHRGAARDAGDARWQGLGHRDERERDRRPGPFALGATPAEPAPTAAHATVRPQGDNDCDRGPDRATRKRGVMTLAGKG